MLAVLVQVIYDTETGLKVFSDQLYQKKLEFSKGGMNNYIKLAHPGWRHGYDIIVVDLFLLANIECTMATDTRNPYAMLPLSA